MPSCMLRVSGSTAKVRKFLATSTTRPARVFWKGDPGTLKGRAPLQVSGFNIELSAAEGIAAQAIQAAKFMRKHKSDLLLIKNLGFPAAIIDFGLYDMATENCPWPSYRMPAGFIQLASELGCGIDLSFYGPPPDVS